MYRKKYYTLNDKFYLCIQFEEKDNLPGFCSCTIGQQAYLQVYTVLCCEESIKNTYKVFEILSFK